MVLETGVTAALTHLAKTVGQSGAQKSSQSPPWVHCDVRKWEGINKQKAYRVNDGTHGSTTSNSIQFRGDLWRCFKLYFSATGDTHRLPMIILIACNPAHYLRCAL